MGWNTSVWAGTAVLALLVPGCGSAPRRWDLLNPCDETPAAEVTAARAITLEEGAHAECVFPARGLAVMFDEPDGDLLCIVANACQCHCAPIEGIRFTPDGVDASQAVRGVPRDWYIVVTITDELFVTATRVEAHGEVTMLGATVPWTSHAWDDGGEGRAALEAWTSVGERHLFVRAEWAGADPDAVPAHLVHTLSSTTVRPTD